MIKNKTQEFKLRYSSCQFKQPRTRKHSPTFIQPKPQNTGFTTISQTTTLRKSSAKKIPKVQSTAFLKSRAKPAEYSDHSQTLIKKQLLKQTSLCRYFNQNKITLQNSLPKKSKLLYILSQSSQKTGSQIQQNITSQLKQKSIFIHQLPDINGFFSVLNPRSLFFCSKCFRYVFAIQKHLHFPKCESQIKVQQLQQKIKQKIAWQKLSMLLELSKYTCFKFKQIQNLFNSSKNKQKNHYEPVIISPNVTYLSFENIVEAFIYTREVLLPNNNQNSSGIFSLNKILSCVDPKAVELNTFLKSISP